MSTLTPNDPIAHMRILTMKQVCEITTYTAQHIYRLIRAKKFPAPIRLGLNRIGFWQKDIETWLAEKQIALPSSDDFEQHAGL
jgi:predicted DNA-binding transcriptional regulator AlpA